MTTLKEEIDRIIPTVVWEEHYQFSDCVRSVFWKAKTLKQEAQHCAERLESMLESSKVLAVWAKSTSETLEEGPKSLDYYKLHMFYCAIIAHGGR